MILISFPAHVDIRYVLLVIFGEISHSYYAVTKSFENTPEKFFFFINCMFDRFVDFVGIEFEQMKMGFVLLAERFV